LHYNNNNSRPHTANTQALSQRPQTANTQAFSIRPNTANTVMDNNDSIEFEPGSNSVIKRERITFSRIQKVRSSLNYYNNDINNNDQPYINANNHEFNALNQIEQLERNSTDIEIAQLDRNFSDINQRKNQSTIYNNYNPSEYNEVSFNKNQNEVIKFSDELLDLANVLEEKKTLGIEEDRMKEFADVFIFENKEMEEDFNNLRKNLGVPTARMEVKSLIKWLNESLQDLLTNDGRTIKDLFLSSMMLYEKSFNEIVRQVSVHCVERG